jgi:GTP cyclohydrolase IB
MEDVQNWIDKRGIPIDRAGIKGIKYPITVFDRDHGRQQTVAEVNMYVDLSSNFKGTHMSRFIEVLNEYRDDFEMCRLTTIVKEIRKRLKAKRSRLEVIFPYFIKRTAPVSNSPSIMEYTAQIIISAHDSKNVDIVVGVKVPISTVCPCSKEISIEGAHNQRSVLTIHVRSGDFVWIEELIELAEKCGSSEIYPLLKREDEKHVTEKAFQNPVFVEDIIRNAAVRLKKDSRILWFLVEAESMESIHNHNAYASLEWSRRKTV